MSCVYSIVVYSIIIIAEPRTVSINAMYTKSVSIIIHVIENSIVHLVIGY